MKTLTLTIAIPEGALPYAITLLRSLQNIFGAMTSSVMQKDSGARALAANFVHECERQEELCVSYLKKENAAQQTLVAASTLAAVAG